MENEMINIAKLLRDMPEGTMLYSPACGKCKLEGVTLQDTPYPIGVDVCNTGKENVITQMTFTKYGQVSDVPDAKCLLFPSEKMRDWSKFFKHGDIVVMNGDCLTGVFDKWLNDDFTKFSMSFGIDAHNSPCCEHNSYSTEDFYKAGVKQHVEFITIAVEVFNGKYNPKTLHIGPAKPKCPFEAFQRVLVRNADADIWRASFFSHYERESQYPYYNTTGCSKQCIPYNERTAHLIGTSDPYPYNEEKGGDK